MKYANNPVDRISQHLNRIETRKRARRRRQWIVATLVLAITGVGAVTLWQPTQRQGSPRRLVSADTLSVQRVAALFQESAVPMVVVHQPDDTTLINSLYEYEELERIRQTLQGMQQENEEETIPMFEVRVSGKKQVGEWLTFQVQPFDSTYSLTLDMGNGITRPVRRTDIRYRYPLPGHFDMHLLLDTADSTLLLQTIKYEIKSVDPLVGA